MGKTAKNNAFDLMFGELTDSEIKASKFKFKVAKAIYLKRKEMGLSQKEFASMLGVTQGMVSRWESFSYNFSIESMTEIFDSLGIEFDVKVGVDVQDYVNAKKLQRVNESCQSKKINGWTCRNTGKLTYIENVQAGILKEVEAS